jgi:hypothetical protein
LASGCDDYEPIRLAVVDLPPLFPVILVVAKDDVHGTAVVVNLKGSSNVRSFGGTRRTRGKWLT